MTRQQKIDTHNKKDNNDKNETIKITGIIVNEQARLH